MTIDYAVNIMSVWKRAPEETRAYDWYGEAQSLASDMAGGDVWRGAGVISALSPRKRWPLNVRIARTSFETGIAYGNMPMHNAIAQRILDGEFTLDVMRGPKTRSFAIAIATAGNGEIATIDCHAHDIAIGRVCKESERNINKTTYNAMAEAYREVADYLGIAVNRVQSVTWDWWRIERGIA
jgi:hypothetical protein